MLTKNPYFSFSWNGIFIMIYLEFFNKERKYDMPFKARVESDELKMLRILNTRMELSEEEKRHYLNLEKGYEGKVKFDLLTEKLQNECYVLNDLLLKSNNSSFQIDTTIIYQEPIYLIDVKNYKGDFIYKTDR